MRWRARKIPCTRVTGKWTYPRKLIDAWIEQSAVSPRIKELRHEQRPVLLAAGSDDPSLGMLHNLFEQQTKPASFFLNPVSSSGGLAAVRDGVVDLATLVFSMRSAVSTTCVSSRTSWAPIVVQMFHRQLARVVTPENPMKLRAGADLVRHKVRMINRQAGSGTRLYLDQALA